MAKVHDTLIGHTFGLLTVRNVQPKTPRREFPLSGLIIPGVTSLATSPGPVAETRCATRAGPTGSQFPVKPAA